MRGSIGRGMEFFIHKITGVGVPLATQLRVIVPSLGIRTSGTGPCISLGTPTSVQQHHDKTQLQECM